MARKESSKAANGLADTIAPARTGYFVRTARAVYALVFLLPIIILYEVLVFLVNPQLLSEPVSNVRGAVVSFIWVQNFLHYLGMDMKSAWLFAPAVVIIILLVLQFASRQSWKVRFGDFPVMACECMVFAIPLIIFSLVLNRVPSQQRPAVGNFDTVITCGSTMLAEVGADSPGISEESRTGRTVGNRQDIYIGLLTGIGAGIYEELIFRLILIGLSMIFFETILGVRHIRAVIISVIISSVLFSLHHHFVFLNGQFTRTAEVLTMTRFTFRTVAGVFFAIIFAVRGFGIAAGAHAFYDIIATLLNAWLFGQC